ncbi:MAG: ABC transporter permease, partial [Treponema sp.]|nr:ABC transporter permease [Treponema sp.]
MSKRYRIIAGAGFSLLVIAAAASLGSSGISLGDTALIILHKVFKIPLSQGVDPRNVSIVWLLRLPR